MKRKLTCSEKAKPRSDSKINVNNCRIQSINETQNVSITINGRNIEIASQLICLGR